jgi:hypothetical protein
MAITLLEMLLDAGLITPGQCDESLQNRVFFGGRIGTNLIELDCVEEEDLARFLSRKLAVPYVDPKVLLNLTPDVIGLIPPDIALQYQVIPLRLDNLRLTIAMADPTALIAIDEISFITGKIIKPMITPEVRLVQALGKYYRYEIDERYQQIIERIEERRQAAARVAALAEAPRPVTAPPAPAADEVSTTVEPTVSAACEEPLQEPWKAQIERYSIDQTSRSLARAEDPGEIGDCLIRFLGQTFGRAALFLIRAEAICGWRAIREGETLADFRQVRIPVTGTSGLESVTEMQTPYLGPLPASPFSACLTEALGGEADDEALLVPVLLGNRTVVVLYAGGSREKLQGEGVVLEKLAAKAALAFEILIAREKILMS